MLNLSRNNSRQIYSYMGFALFICLILIFPDSVSARDLTTGGELPYETFLGRLKASITGPFAGAVSLIGIVVAGAVLIFGGDLNGFFRSLVFLVLVISVIVSGGSIITGITSAEVIVPSSAELLVK